MYQKTIESIRLNVLALLAALISSSYIAAEPLSIPKVPCGEYWDIYDDSSPDWGWSMGKTGRTYGPFKTEREALFPIRIGWCKDMVGCMNSVCPEAAAMAENNCENAIREKFLDDNIYGCSSELAKNPVCHHPPFKGCTKKEFGGRCKIDNDYGKHIFFGEAININGLWYGECSCMCVHEASGRLMMGCSDCEEL